jgi:hypothetical protein
MSDKPTTLDLRLAIAERLKDGITVADMFGIPVPTKIPNVEQFLWVHSFKYIGVNEWASIVNDIERSLSVDDRSNYFTAMIVKYGDIHALIATWEERAIVLKELGLI